MANITLTGGFKVCPEGEHIFRIYKVDYNQDFGKLAVYLVNAKGITHVERFNLMTTNGEPNEKAYNRFSFFAKTALNDFKAESIDHTDLINKYIKVVVTHNVVPSTTEPGKTVTFVNLDNFSVVDGFDTECVAKALTLGTQPTDTPKQGVDLNSLLD